MAPAFADAGFGKFTRLRNNPTSNGYHLVDPSEFQLVQASPGAGNQETSSAPAEPSMAELAQKANNPLSDVWLLIGQNDTTLFGGDLVVQPDDVAPEWNFKVFFSPIILNPFK